MMSLPFANRPLTARRLLLGAAGLAVLLLAAYYLLVLILAVVPLLIVLAHRDRLPGRRRRGLIAELAAAAGGYLLGRSRGLRQLRQPPRTLRVHGERYDSPADARRAARELLVQLGNTPEGTAEWQGLADHIEALLAAAAGAKVEH